jgi:hypothetical protein
MIVYLITNKVNGKRYVGQTVQTLKERWSKHCHVTHANEGMPIVKAIQKYGKESFEKKVLAKCNSIEEMNYRESYYIELLDTRTPNGYNVLSGGGNSLHTEESKKKIAIAQTGEKNHNFGKKASLETRIKMSKGHMGLRRSEEVKRACSERVTGEKHPMFGKHHTEESARKISKSLMGRIFSPESIEKMSKSRDKDKVKIFCFETDTEYESVTMAAKVLDLDRCKIKEVAKGKRSHTYGYTFKFIEEGKK